MLFIQFLSEKCIAVPANSVDDFVTAATPTMSRSGSFSPSVISGKRSARARSSDASTDQSDGTVRGSDSEEDDRFTTVVNKKRSRRLRQRRSADNNSPSMYIDIQPAAPITFTDSPASPDSPVTSVARGPVTATKQAISGTESAKIFGAKPTVPSKAKPPPPIYLSDKGK
ncbi:hypothetical protein EVAR_6593_1 [Eumeta japonica]|uniref:Uncharacterized protein n=1 Tax=Eumeta variegata TaxID=151549 RepID=A0A4C1TMP7_EUMVA|nr:hypothetical protein EVAR_6593_1 [Eumeta japonica]